MQSSSSSKMPVPSSSGGHNVSSSTSTGIQERSQIPSHNGFSTNAHYSAWNTSLTYYPAASTLDDDSTSNSARVGESKLTSSSHDSRSSRQPITPYNNPTSDPSPNAAIPFPLNNTYHNTRQDVPTIVNPSASYSKHPSPVYRNVYSTPPLESPLSSFPASSHGSLNTSSTRLRTSTQVFHTQQDLAAHYGIPQILPPAPCTAPRRTQQQQPASVPDFAALRSNYLNMLTQKPEDNSTATGTAPAAPVDSAHPAQTQQDDVVQTLMNVLLASPDLYSPEFNEFNANDYITSPFDDSPLSDFLTTPVVSDSNDLNNMLTSPLIDGYNGAYNDMDLFNDMSMFEDVAKAPVSAPSFENLYTMSPGTPALDPTSIYPSPRVPSDKHSFPTVPAPARRKTSATGTRKNITPESLVPLDAPTQPRKYALPSATSRKEVPTVFARKRARSQAFGDDDDEGEEPLPPNATEKEQIEWKRRQNTLAARKSRKRKLMHQQQLEEQVEKLAGEKMKWKTRALMSQQMLISNGLPDPGYTDDD